MDEFNELIKSLKEDIIAAKIDNSNQKISTIINLYQELIQKKYTISIILTKTPIKRYTSIIPNDSNHKFNIILFDFYQKIKHIKGYNIFYINSPKDLTEISICLNECINNSSDKHVVIIEQPSIFFKYNPKDICEQFFNTIIQRLKLNDISILGIDDNFNKNDFNFFEKTIKLIEDKK